MQQSKVQNLYETFLQLLTLVALLQRHDPIPNAKQGPQHRTVSVHAKRLHPGSAIVASRAADMKVPTLLVCSPK